MAHSKWDLDIVDPDRKMRNEIDNMSQLEICKLYRFAPAGHWAFKGIIGRYFGQAMKVKGGMTPEISKQIGLGDTPRKKSKTYKNK